MADYLGITGLALILAGWTVELYHALKNGKSGVPLSFAALYAAGSLLLTWHSMEIGDAVFTILNAAAAIVAFINIALNLAGGKGGKKGKN